MKCVYCGKEFSDKIIKLHQKDCKENPKNKEIKLEKKEKKNGN